MLKLSLVVMFVLSLATLSFASSLMPMPATAPVDTPAFDLIAEDATTLTPAEIEPRLWVQTFE